VEESAVILFDERGTAFQALRFGDRRLTARDSEMLRPALGIGTLKGDSRLRHYFRGFLSSKERSWKIHDRAHGLLPDNYGAASNPGEIVSSGSDSNRAGGPESGGGFVFASGCNPHRRGNATQPGGPKKAAGFRA